MQQPHDFINPHNPHFVCKLHKVIYDLKQVPKAWFAALSYWLITYGGSSSIANPSLFIFQTHYFLIFLLIYVDYMIIVSCCYSITANKLLTSLSLAFSVKNLGHLSYFFGV